MKRAKELAARIMGGSPEQGQGKLEREVSRVEAEIKEGLKDMIRSVDAIGQWIDQWQEADRDELENRYQMGTDEKFAGAIRLEKEEAINGAAEWAEYAHQTFADLEDIKGLTDEEIQLMHDKLDEVDRLVETSTGGLKKDIQSRIDQLRTSAAA